MKRRADAEALSDFPIVLVGRAMAGGEGGVEPVGEHRAGVYREASAIGAIEEGSGVAGEAALMDEARVKVADRGMQDAGCRMQRGEAAIKRRQ